MFVAPMLVAGKRSGALPERKERLERDFMGQTLQHLGDYLEERVVYFLA